MGPQMENKLKDLIMESKDGNSDAYREIFDHLNNRLFVYALAHTSSRDDALDLVQDTFIDLWNALKNFQYKSNEGFYGYVFIIVKRKLAKYYGANKKNVVSLDRLSEKDLGDHYEMEHEDSRYLLRELNKLAVHYSELLKLRYWSGMTFGEIALVLNIKETTAKVRHHRALQILKINLDKFYNERL